MKWQEVQLNELAEFQYGKMPPKDILADEGFPIYSGYRITGYAKKYLYRQD